MKILFRASLLLLLSLSGFAQGAVIEKMISIPVTETNGNIRQLQTRLCIPSSGRGTAVIINHGSPASAEERPNVVGYKCDSEAVQWFLAKGYLVVSPIRRGYGATGGEYSESFGKCKHPDFFKAGLETSRDIQAVIDVVTKLPEALEDQVVVIGQSAGGWGTIALSSVAHPKVKALINMAGGRGGHQGPRHDQNCAPEILAKAAGQYGSTATTPMLWMYAENDSFFSPKIANSLYDAFTAAGGKAEFIHGLPFGKDGHLQFAASGGSKIWGPIVKKYLSKQLKK